MVERCSDCQRRQIDCPLPFVCEVPAAIEVRPISRRLFTTRPLLTAEGWCRLVGAGLGLGTFVLFAREAVRHLFT